jgi:HK97 family phage prohead protease
VSIERRFTSGKVELRTAEGGASQVIGYAAVFNSPSNTLRSNRGPFVEILEPGAFENVMNDDVRALFNHDANYILARSNAGKGTLTLSTDDKGLRYEFTAPNTSYAQDLQESMKRGDIDASSFAFELREGGDKWEMRDGMLTRTIKRGGISRLHDVSPVTYPAYKDSEVSIRSLDEFLNGKSADKENLTPEREIWAARFGIKQTPSPAK